MTEYFSKKRKFRCFFVLFPSLAEPKVQCGDERIDVVINKGLVEELGLDGEAKYIYFGRSSATNQCRATEQNNLYQLSIRAPFSNCGTQVIVSTLSF